MDGFYPSLMKLWNEWNLQVTVLLSLVLQLMLIVLGNCRKHDSRRWIRFVTWCVYLSADIVATFGLGLIAKNMSNLYEKNGGSVDAKTELTAFWSPFLLMHLGGPDTITAYSLEDNELWSRHFLVLVVQMAMAVFVCFMAWTGSLLSFLSLLMLFAGLIKYGERTWVLMKASQEEIIKSYADRTLYAESSTLHGICGHNLSLAYALMSDCFQPLLLDLNQSSVFKVFEALSESSEEDPFQIIEMSLAFMYNNLYTKALLLYTHVGLGLRVITGILTSSVLVLFLRLIHKHKYSKIDVTITHILLFGAIILEICSALLLLFSDRFRVWLIQHKKDLMASMLEAVEGVLKNRSWSNKMSQLSLQSFSAKEKPLPCLNFLMRFSIVKKLENRWHAADIEISNDLKTLILSYLKVKRDRTNTGVGMGIDFSGMDFTKELEKSIFAWHVATEKWYERDQNCFGGNKHVIESICQISRYMFSLLVLHPDMVSNANTTSLTLQAILVATRRSPLGNRMLEFLDGELGFEHSEWLLSVDLSDVHESINVFYCRDLPDVYLRLKQKIWQERWMIISCTWLEMLPYLACKCNGMQHARRLVCGGEFLTHVWLLTKSFAFTEKDFTSQTLSWSSSIARFDGPSSSEVQYQS